MKIFNLILITGSLIAGMAQAQIQLPRPVQSKPVPNCVIPKVDGDKVPFPLRNANTKFELAENETYLLNGYLFQRDGRVYFKVDFETQPYLMTAKLSLNPFFVVDPSDYGMIQGVGAEMVQMAVVARKNDLIPAGEVSHGVKLHLITGPAKF